MDRHRLAVLHGGIDEMSMLVDGLQRWMEAREIAALTDMRGMQGWQRNQDRSVYTQANSLRILERHSAN